MSYHVVIPVLVSFALSLVLGPIVIPSLETENGNRQNGKREYSLI